MVGPAAAGHLGERGCGGAAHSPEGRSPLWVLCCCWGGSSRSGRKGHPCGSSTACARERLVQAGAPAGTSFSHNPAPGWSWLPARGRGGRRGLSHGCPSPVLRSALGCPPVLLPRHTVLASWVPSLCPPARAWCPPHTPALVCMASPARQH